MQSLDGLTFDGVLFSQGDRALADGESFKVDVPFVLMKRKRKSLNIRALTAGMVARSTILPIKPY